MGSLESGLKVVRNGAIAACYVQDDAEQRADIRVFWVLVLVVSWRITPTVGIMVSDIPARSVSAHGNFRIRSTRRYGHYSVSYQSPYFIVISS